MPLPYPPKALHFVFIDLFIVSCLASLLDCGQSLGLCWSLLNDCERISGEVHDKSLVTMCGLPAGPMSPPALVYCNPAQMQKVDWGTDLK